MKHRINMIDMTLMVVPMLQSSQIANATNGARIISAIQMYNNFSFPVIIDTSFLEK